MLVAILVLFALYLTGKQKERLNQGVVPENKETRRKKTRSRNVSVAENSDNDAVVEGFKCQHHFGFLKTRKNKSIPDECAGCEKLVNCMLPKK